MHCVCAHTFTDPVTGRNSQKSTAREIVADTLQEVRESVCEHCRAVSLSISLSMSVFVPRQSRKREKERESAVSEKKFFRETERERDCAVSGMREIDGQCIDLSRNEGREREARREREKIVREFDFE